MQQVHEQAALLYKGSLDERHATVLALGASHHRAAVEPLVAAFADSQRSVQVAAVEALGQLGHPEAIPYLQQLLDGNEAQLRLHAAESLGALASTVSDDSLVLFLRERFSREGDDPVRQALLMALARAGDHLWLIAQLDQGLPTGLQATVVLQAFGEAPGPARTALREWLAANSGAPMQIGVLLPHLSRHPDPTFLPLLQAMILSPLPADAHPAFWQWTEANGQGPSREQARQAVLVKVKDVAKVSEARVDRVWNENRGKFIRQWSTDRQRIAIDAVLAFEDDVAFRGMLACIDAQSFSSKATERALQAWCADRDVEQVREWYAEAMHDSDLPQGARDFALGQWYRHHDPTDDSLRPVLLQALADGGSDRRRIALEALLPVLLPEDRQLILPLIEDQALADQAIIALGACAHPDDEAFLLARLRETPVHEWPPVIEALKNYRSSELRQAIITHYRELNDVPSKRQWIQRPLLMLASRQHHDDMIPLIREALTHKDKKHHIVAYRSLTHLGTPAANALLIEALSEAEEPPAAALQEAIHSRNEEVLEVVYQCFLREQRPMLVEQLITQILLHEQEAAVVVLCRRLERGDAYEGRLIAEGLLHRSAQATPHLLKLLANEVEATRGFAAQILVGIGTADERIAPACLALLREDKPTTWPQVMAVAVACTPAAKRAPLDERLQAITRANDGRLAATARWALRQEAP